MTFFPTNTEGTRETESVKSLADRAILISVQFGKLGTSRKIPSASIVGRELTKADLARIRSSKKLLEHPLVKEIASQDERMIAWIKARSLSGPFKKGIYILPFDLLEEVDAKLQAYTQTIRPFMVEKVKASWEEIIADDRGALDNLFNFLDYPQTGDEAAARYGADIRYITMSVPEKLSGISQRIYQREVQRAATEIEALKEDIKVALREGLKELLDHAVERLTGTRDNGKPKIFKNSMVENINQFLDVFDARNLADDEELKEEVEKLRDILRGVDPNTLRESLVARDLVRGRFEAVKTELDLMVVNRPRRRVILDDAPAGGVEAAGLV